MTSIQPVNQMTKKPLLTAANTGYAVLTGMVLTTGSAMVQNKSVRKCHKPFAYITGALALLHTGIVLYNRNKWKKYIGKAEDTQINKNIR